MQAPEQNERAVAASPVSGKRWRRRTFVFAVIAIVLWLTGDFVYSLVTASRLLARESQIQRGSDGVQIGCEARTLAGGPIGLLLVHGFNDSPRAFRKIAPVLNQQGFTVRLVRLPGFAEPVANAEKYHCEDWIDEVVRVATDMRKSCERIVLAGHSLGGAVAIASVLGSPETFDGLILIAPALDVSNDRSPILPARWWQAVGQRLFLFTRYYESPFDRNDARDPAERNPEYKSPFSPRSHTIESFRLMDSIRPRAAEIGLPVLMILTRDDRVVDWLAAERFFYRMRSGYREIRFFDTSGHALTVDYDWRKVTSAMGDFTLKVAGK